MRALFITHAGSRIGGGHLSRCLALAQALGRQGVECEWLLNGESRSQAVALGIEGAVFESDPFAASFAHLSGFQFAVVDSYAPPTAFYEALAERIAVVAIDDLYDRGVERFARVLVNYGVGARRDLYAETGCAFLLGPQNALLRMEYWELQPETGDYVLFVPGAADVLSSSEIMIGLWRPEWPPLSVVLGALVPEQRRIAAQARAEGRVNVEVRTAPTNFPELLADAGMVICSASVTAYEALAMEKRLTVFSVAPNQRGLGALLRRSGVAYDMSDWESVDERKVADALAFAPDAVAIGGLVRRDGALRCARSLLSLLEETK